MELSFRRTVVHSVEDFKRLSDGEDLNDALLDFFVKLGQALVPAGGGGPKSVSTPPRCGLAYLGSLFYSQLRKGDVQDGREGHTNVANWARRRLGKGGLFDEGIGALALPINETLREGKGGFYSAEKHWWLALLINPRGAGAGAEAEGISLVPMDSFMRMDWAYEPPVRALQDGEAEAYPVEVKGFTREGFMARVRFRASGDGSRGKLVHPSKSLLLMAGQEFSVKRCELTVDRPGDDGEPGLYVGILEFHVDSELKAKGEYTLEYGGEGAYRPLLKLNMDSRPSECQGEAAKFFGGYLAKEWETSADRPGGQEGKFEEGKLVQSIRIPEVPQQERSNDCGFFVLEQILQVLQLSPEALRALAKASAEEIAQLPWPSQRQVTIRKEKLRECLKDIMQAAKELGLGDVEVLIKRDASLRKKVQACLWDGPSFSEAVGKWVEGQRPRFKREDLDGMKPKELRSLCVQYGVLPGGLVERTGLIEALRPLAVDAQPPPAQAAAAPSSGPGRPPPAPRPKAPARAKDFLAGDPFTREELDGLTAGKLRTLCIQRGCLPAGVSEKAPLVEALAPFAVGGAAPARKPAPVPQTVYNAAPKASAPAAAPGGGGAVFFPAQPNVQMPAAARAAAAEIAARIAGPAAAARPSRPAPAPAPGEVMPGASFTFADLNRMPTKGLKALCVQYGVMPAGTVERENLLEALQPLAEDAQGSGGAEAKRRRLG